MEYVFISNEKNLGLRITTPANRNEYGKITGGQTLAKFNKQAGFGMFTTSDPKVAEQLRSHPSYGESLEVIFGDTNISKDDMEIRKNQGYVGRGIFTEVKDGKMPVIRKSTKLVQGPVTSVSPNEKEVEKLRKELEDLKKQSPNPKEAIEFGELKTKLLKNDGSYRADAGDEDKKRYEELKVKFKE